jgi:hypothetical protein
MTFEDWMMTKDCNYYPTDDSMAIRKLRECWNAAQKYSEAEQRLAAKDAEIAEESHLCERMSKLLSLTAIALKGPNEERSLHSWHDLPEKAEELKQKLAAKQAQIDELMLEYCPDEMTEEQIAEYKRHQVPISDEEQEFINKVIGK